MTLVDVAAHWRAITLVVTVAVIAALAISRYANEIDTWWDNNWEDWD